MSEILDSPVDTVFVHTGNVIQMQESGEPSS